VLALGALLCVEDAGPLPFSALGVADELVLGSLELDVSVPLLRCWSSFVEVVSVDALDPLTTRLTDVPEFPDSDEPFSASMPVISAIAATNATTAPAIGTQTRLRIRRFASSGAGTGACSAGTRTVDPFSVVVLRCSGTVASGSTFSEVEGATVVGASLPRSTTDAPLGSLTFWSTVSLVRSRERWYTAVTTVLTTEPRAAPVTVPVAPKNEPMTAVVAAAPAPASTLLTVRLGAAAGVAAVVTAASVVWPSAFTVTRVGSPLLEPVIRARLSSGRTCCGIDGAAGRPAVRAGPGRP
jgi:hypothetical protein